MTTFHKVVWIEDEPWLPAGGCWLSGSDGIVVAMTARMDRTRTCIFARRINKLPCHDVSESSQTKNKCMFNYMIRCWCITKFKWLSEYLEGKRYSLSVLFDICVVCMN